MKKYLFVVAMIAVFSLVLGGCDITISGNNPAVVSPPSSGSGGTAHLGMRTKTSGCVAHGGLPDSACTPGAIFQNATVQQICTYGYASSVRNVPFGAKDQAYAEYGIGYHYSGEFETDHLVPLELGGSNDIANLWPEAASPVPGFHTKDQLENVMHGLVCDGKLPLHEAQIEMSTNWLAAYVKYIGPLPK